MKVSSLTFLLLVPLTACGHQNPAPLLSRSISDSAPIRSSLKNSARHQRLRVISQAKEQLAQRKTYRSRTLQFQTDPIGFIQAAYWNAGVDLFDSSLALDLDMSGLALIYETARKRRQWHTQNPRPGDLVFLRSTNSPQTEADIPDQLAVIESVGSDRTLTVLGFFANGPRRIVINVQQKRREYGKLGKRINDRLSVERDKQGTLGGSIVLGFADPFESLPGDIRVQK